MSRRSVVLRAAFAAAVLFAIPASSIANHIVVAGPLWYPVGPGTNEVSFIHTEIESTQCCGGGPVYSFGDGTYGYIDAYINQYTSPGTYTGYLFDVLLGYLGTYPVEVQHAGAPPLEVGDVPNTVITFSHTYSAAGPYTVTWSDCCLGSPQLPQYAPEQVPDPPRAEVDSVLATLHELLLSGAQSEIDSLWYTELVPLFEGTVQAVSPVGVSGGTAAVVAV